jgi:hypothetical protein
MTKFLIVGALLTSVALASYAADGVPVVAKGASAPSAASAPASSARHVKRHLKARKPTPDAVRPEADPDKKDK